MVARQAHNLEADGSNPSRATSQVHPFFEQRKRNPAAIWSPGFGASAVNAMGKDNSGGDCKFSFPSGKGFSPLHPSIKSYIEYRRVHAEMLAEIYRRLSMPKKALGNGDGYNYASAVMDSRTYLGTPST